MHTLLLASRTFYIYYSSITPEAKSRVYIYLSYIPSKPNHETRRERLSCRTEVTSVGGGSELEASWR